MAGGDLFQGLPPPASISTDEVPILPEKTGPCPLPAVTTTPAPALKSALKRDNPPEQQAEREANKKRLRFKTTTDATEKQVIDAMQKIASHISNPLKFSKASKLALQVIQAGSVTNATSGYFFAILEAAMANSASYNELSLRADYRSLFTAAEGVKECLSKDQQNQLTTWTVKAVVANDLYTDDSFVFSKAAGKIKEAICNLPVASPADDKEEVASLMKIEKCSTSIIIQNSECPAVISEPNEETLDPFGLDALLPDKSKKVEKLKAKKEIVTKENMDLEEEKRFLKSQRETLILCLEIAARRYRVAWAQTVIDILVKHAFDNVARFTSKQRDAIEKLWASIREQQIRRRQGKLVTGKLDVTDFESLQEKYANQKISIRHSVGGDGERRAQQWLG